MVLNYNLLLTYADCDQATADVDFKLVGLAADDAVDTATDARATRTQTTVGTQLGTVNRELASLDFQLTDPNLDTATQDELRSKRKALEVRQEGLQKRNATVTGPKRFLDDATNEEVDLLVTFWTNVKAGIATRRSVLSA
ncbi:hypothetical protein [Hymenobacter terrenus]|uniref:hypothetical protein n=1 Tax=Hymenobacter terrenus TaxID=1629124 RepID=UPI0006197579|nr:hypothetical protein [Hymenobacter terrenus]